MSCGAWEVGSPQSRAGSKDTSRHVVKEGWGKAVCAHPRVLVKVIWKMLG